MKETLAFTPSTKPGFFETKFSATEVVGIQLNRPSISSLIIEQSIVEPESDDDYSSVKNYGSTSGPKNFSTFLTSDSYDKGIPVYWRILSSTMPNKAYIIKA